MKEAAVTAMRHVGELADLVRFLPGFFGSITSHVKKRTSRAPEMGHFAAYKPHCGVFVVLVGCIKLLTTAALTENGRARRGFDLFACGSKSEGHLRKKMNPAVTRSAVADPANSRHLKNP